MATETSKRVHFYVVLRFSSLNLIVAQHDIRFVEVLEDVQTQLEAGEAAAGVAGWLTHGEEQFPVFCLSHELEPLSFIPEGRRYCVILETSGEEATYGLLCAEIIPLAPNYPLHIQPIPEAMRNNDSPILNLATYESGIGCVSSAEALVGYISAWSERHLAQFEADLE